MSPGDTDVTVRTTVQRAGQAPVPIDYSMEKSADGWKAYDVVVAGVSLVTNYRDEFNDIVKSSGIDGLIKTLSAKNAGAAVSERFHARADVERQALDRRRAADDRQYRCGARREYADASCRKAAKSTCGTLSLSIPPVLRILLEWKRRALAEDKPISFQNIPPSMTSLAALYGVDELLMDTPA